jgi:hypothetical protein
MLKGLQKSSPMCKQAKTKALNTSKQRARRGRGLLGADRPLER